VIDRDALRALLAQVDARLEAPLEVLIVGGAALLALCEDAQATRDIDAFASADLGAFRSALDRAVSERALAPVDFNARSSMFEALLPDSWERRVVWSPALSTRHIRLGTPSPADLAVMKTYRYSAKDAVDIARLAALPDFDFVAFRRGFLEVLPRAPGAPRYHAQSFAMAWNALRPSEPVELDDLLAGEGGSRRPRRKR
jgi:hypothetical protein